jgi:hypothetical protein
MNCAEALQVGCQEKNADVHTILSLTLIVTMSVLDVRNDRKCTPVGLLAACCIDRQTLYKVVAKADSSFAQPPRRWNGLFIEFTPLDIAQQSSLSSFTAEGCVWDPTAIIRSSQKGVGYALQRSKTVCEQYHIKNTEGAPVAVIKSDSYRTTKLRYIVKFKNGASEKGEERPRRSISTIFENGHLIASLELVKRGSFSRQGMSITDCEYCGTLLTIQRQCRGECLHIKYRTQRRSSTDRDNRNRNVREYVRQARGIARTGGTARTPRRPPFVGYIII